MQKRQSYIMRDQVRNQVRSIMAWKPHRADEPASPSLGLLLGRMVIRAADSLYRSLQNPTHATRVAH